MSDISQNQLDEISRRCLSITGGIPQASPDKGSSEWACDQGEILHCRGTRVLVQTNLGVGEIVIVDQDELRSNLAQGFSDLGELTVNVELSSPDPLQETILTRVIETHCQAMRAKGRPLLGRSLSNVEISDYPRVIDGHLGVEGVYSCGLEPQFAPGPQCATARILEFLKEVCERGITPLVFDEVVVDSCKEGFLSHPCHQLFENGATFGIGNAIEIDLDILDVADICDDRVGGGQLVLTIGP